jgi:RNase P subunit RPR2
MCPVCSALLTIDDTLVARMIENEGKTSVKIFGCSKCREVPR